MREGGDVQVILAPKRLCLEIFYADISARLHKLDDTAAEQMKHLSWIFIKMPLLEKCD